MERGIARSVPGRDPPQAPFAYTSGMRPLWSAPLPWLLLALAFASGCDDPGPSVLGDDPPPPAQTMSAEACASAVDAMEAALPEPGPFAWSGGQALPEAHHGEPLEALPFLQITRGLVQVDGRQAGRLGEEETPDVVVGHLEEVATRWPSLHPGERWDDRVILQVFASEPAAPVWRLLAALPEQLTYDLMVQDADEPVPGRDLPAPEWVVEAWSIADGADDPRSAHAVLQEAFHRAVADCLAARPHAQLLYALDTRARTAAEGEPTLSDSLRACQCVGLDFEALTPLLVRALTPNHRPLVRLPLRARAGEGRGALGLSGDATVADLVGAFDALPDAARAAPVAFRFGGGEAGGDAP